MIFSMYSPTFLRLCSMSRFEKRMTRISYFSMRLLRFSSVFHAFQRAMLRAVDFDDAPCFPAEEINDVAFYDILAVDLHRNTLQAIIPEERLLRRHVATQFASSLFHGRVFIDTHKEKPPCMTFRITGKRVRPSPRAYSVSILDVFLPYETVLKRVPP